MAKQSAIPQMAFLPDLLYHKKAPYFRFHRCQNRGFAAVLAAICVGAARVRLASAPSAPTTTFYIL